MKPRHVLFGMVFLALIGTSIWIAFAQDASTPLATSRESEERAQVVAVVMDMVDAALSQDVDAFAARTDPPVAMVEGITGRSRIVKKEEIEVLFQTVFVPGGVELEVSKAEVLLMGKTASAQMELALPGGPDLGLSGRCAFLLVKKEGEWKVKAAAYYGY